ncbi:MAG: hypothetical protein R2864_02480 [Syntrophotaleaceae bacterium]
MPRRKRFGEILVDAKVLDEITLSRALEKQRVSDMRLGEVLEEMGIISDRDVVLILARQFNCKTVSNISKHPFPEEVLGLIDCDTALEKGIFPSRQKASRFTLPLPTPRPGNPRQRLLSDRNAGGAVFDHPQRGAGRHPQALHQGFREQVRRGADGDGSG